MQNRIFRLHRVEHLKKNIEISRQRFRDIIYDGGGTAYAYMYVTFLNPGKALAFSCSPLPSPAADAVDQFEI